MRLGTVQAAVPERRVHMERSREERRVRALVQEQEHLQLGVKQVSHNTLRLQAEAERIERALKHPEHLVGSKEPVRDGHAATRFNGISFSLGGYYGGVAPAARPVLKIGSQRSLGGRSYSQSKSLPSLRSPESHSGDNDY